MKKLILSSGFLLLICYSLSAQKAPAVPPSNDKTQSITIRKKGNDKQKTTIVIDGDNITVNGKPLNEYKGDIQIAETNSLPDDYARSLPPLPPVYLHGGAKSYSGSFNFNSNSAFLGIATENDKEGAKVREVTKDSPAEKAGLKTGDVITKIGTDKIEDADDLVDAVGDHKPNDKVNITYLRDQKENNTTATLSQNKQRTFAWDKNNDFATAFRNFSGDWNNNTRLGIHVEDTEASDGVKITDLEDETPATKAGLKKDDIITQINGKKITSVKDAKDALKDSKPGDNLSVSYTRNGTLQTANLHLPKPLEDSDL